MSIEARVARGAALLDARDPGWALRLPRLSRLAIKSGTNCVLGQLYGYVWDGLHRLGIRIDDLEAYGFAEWDRRQQRAMTEAWRALIRARRADGGRA
jgi:hypothetical protein